MTEEIIEEITERKNPICVVSKETYGEYGVRDIQTNSGWMGNPYGDDYALVPDEFVHDIIETKGFCDIELNEEGTEVVRFTPKDIPEITETASGPTPMDKLEAQVTYTAMMTDTLIV